MRQSFAGFECEVKELARKKKKYVCVHLTQEENKRESDTLLSEERISSS